MQNSGLFGTQSELTKCGVGCCNPILSEAGLHYLSCQKHLDMCEIKKKIVKRLLLVVCGTVILSTAFLPLILLNCACSWFSMKEKLDYLLIYVLVKGLISVWLYNVILEEDI